MIIKKNKMYAMVVVELGDTNMDEDEISRREQLLRKNLQDPLRSYTWDVEDVYEECAL